MMRMSMMWVRVASIAGALLAGTASGQNLSVAGTVSAQAVSVSGTLTVQGTTISPLAQVPAGTVLPFAGSTAPPGFMLCDGSRLSRTTYATLFSVIGTAFGWGDATTTFNVPDLRGIFVRGKSGANVTFGASAVISGSQVITANGHGFNRSGVPVRFTTTGILPAPLNANTTYWVVWISANTFGVAMSEAYAMSPTYIVFTSQGTGSHTAVEWSDPDASSRTALAQGGASGNSVGAKQEDALQGHYHTTGSGSWDTSANVAAYGRFPDFSGATGPNPQRSVGAPTTDGTNGAPRTAAETRPRNVAMNYIIKY